MWCKNKTEQQQQGETEKEWEESTERRVEEKSMAEHIRKVEKKNKHSQREARVKERNKLSALMILFTVILLHNSTVLYMRKFIATLIFWYSVVPTLSIVYTFATHAFHMHT